MPHVPLRTEQARGCEQQVRPGRHHQPVPNTSSGSGLALWARVPGRAAAPPSAENFAPFVAAAGAADEYICSDPRGVVAGPLDPDLDAIRSHLIGHRRRLWIRRIVRRAWTVASVVLGAEVGLLLAGRLVPIEALPSLLISVAVIGVAGFVLLAVRCRPSIGETALAIDAEGHLGDRAASALALATAYPGIATATDGVDGDDRHRSDRR